MGEPPFGDPEVQGGGRMRHLIGGEPENAETPAVPVEATAAPAQGGGEVAQASAVSPEASAGPRAGGATEGGPAALAPAQQQAPAAKPASTSAPTSVTPAPLAPSDAEATSAIVGVHGGAGPWVVAGYRMGLYALYRLRLAKGSFDLEVTHHSPREVQYSCIADGAAAATGASLGRLSLSLAEAPVSGTRTTYLKRSTGEHVTLQTTPEFAARYKDVPRPQLLTAGQEVLHLPDSAIFREVP